MGCIRVDKITEYLCEPLRKCLLDEDPYVRKTAAVCVAKLHDINASLVEDQGFLDQLKELLSDSNPMVSRGGGGRGGGLSGFVGVCGHVSDFVDVIQRTGE